MDTNFVRNRVAEMVDKIEYAEWIGSPIFDADTARGFATIINNLLDYIDKQGKESAEIRKAITEHTARLEGMYDGIRLSRHLR